MNEYANNQEDRPQQPVNDQSNIKLTPSQRKILLWLTDKNPVSVTEAMEQGLGRLGVSAQTVRVSLELLAKQGLVVRHKSSRIVPGFGYAVTTGRSISVIKYSVKS